MDKEKIKRKLAKAIVDKFGSSVAIDLSDAWTPSKEKQYQESVKEHKAYCSTQENDKINVGGILFPVKLIKKEEHKLSSCKICKVLSFKLRDEVYMSKYNVCEKCYIEHIEGREHEKK